MMGFNEWRVRARTGIMQGVPPTLMDWGVQVEQSELFADNAPLQPVTQHEWPVPRAFTQMAERTACHADPMRWDKLYTLLWRLTRGGEKHALQLVTDKLVHDLNRMDTQVRRDAHKAKAFVRFRLVKDEKGAEHYIAWHIPDHHILPMVAPFFQRRFAVMNWSILTPHQSVSWDGACLQFGPGAKVEDAPEDDRFEDIWRAYYKSTFNPARVKVAMMKREMPVRYWPCMPETDLIPELLANAANRVDKMIKR